MDRNINIKLGKDKNLILNTDYPFRIHLCEDKHVDLIEEILNLGGSNIKNLENYNLILNIFDLDTHLVQDLNMDKFSDFLNINSLTPYQINYIVSINNYDKCRNNVISSISNICVIVDNNAQDLGRLYSGGSLIKSSYIVEKLNNTIYRMDFNRKNILNSDKMRINDYTIPFYNFKNFIEKKIVYWIKINESNDTSSIIIEKIDLTNEYDECAECELRIFCNGFHRDSRAYCEDAIRFFKDGALELIDEIY